MQQFAGERGIRSFVGRFLCGQAVGNLGMIAGQQVERDLIRRSQAFVSDHERFGSRESRGFGNPLAGVLGDGTGRPRVGDWKRASKEKLQEITRSTKFPT